MANLSVEDHHGIPFPYEEGKEWSEIAGITRFPRCGIRSTINKYRETSSVFEKKPKIRTTKKLSSKDEQDLEDNILKELKEDKR